MRSINASSLTSWTFAVALFLECAVVVPALAQESPYRRIQPAATGVARPEDLVRLPGSVWVVTSSMRGPDGEPGRLFLVNAAGASEPRPLYPSHESRNDPDHARFPSCSSPPDLSVFYPHGLTVTSLKDGGVELLVVNHGGARRLSSFE